MRVLYHEKYMEIALSEANKAYNENEIPVGCAVVMNDDVIAAAHNHVEANGDPLAHAEIIAMTMARQKLGERYLTDCVVYTTLEPCGMCAGAIARLRPKLIVFGAFDTEFGCIVSSCNLPRNMGVLIPAVGGIMENECNMLLNSFFSNLRDGQNSKID